MNTVRSSREPIGDPPQLTAELLSLRDVKTTTKEIKDVPLPVDILLITARDCEFLACYAQMINPFRCYFEDVGYVYFDGEDERQQEKVSVALVRSYQGPGGPGGTQETVKNAATLLRPKAVLCVGTCSALNPNKTKQGDVVLSAKVHATTCNLTPCVSRRFLNVIKNAADGYNAPLKNPEAYEIKLHCDGEFLSLQEQVSNEGRREELAKSYPQATAMETGGAGIFTAAFDNQIEWLIVKGICDYADGAEGTAESWSNFASVMAASVAAHILSDPCVFRKWPNYGDEQSGVEGNVKRQRTEEKVEENQTSTRIQISPEIADCEGDIAFFAYRHDPDTRKWLIDDFDIWFNDPGDSRAYVLLGDAGVGKSVIAGALGQYTRKAGRLGAAYFCRHSDGTRNDPRYLLGTVACHLCYCNSEYNNLVGGEDGVRIMLANSKLGVQELFTKLLEEPLSKCTPCQQRKLVIIDALDETQYESREDFLELIKERFPRLPKWLVFFITSRPEHTIQNRLERYNPCVRICAGSSEQSFFYRQHEQDIMRFLQKRLDFSRLSYSVEDITKTCSGLFLYAFYIVKVLNDPVHSGKIDQFSDLFPGHIDDFFRKNFKRLYDKVGKDTFTKLFGCLIAAPSPLPVAIIGYILEREMSDQDEQEVIDVVSQFVVFRTSDRSLTFLHNLIPAWLTDKEKAERLFIDKKMAGEYLSKIFTEILSTSIDEAQRPLPTVDKRLKEYVSRVAVRFLCHQNGDKDSLKLVSSCLTSYHFLQQRIQSGRIEIYNLLEDLKLVADCYAFKDAHKQKILQEISLAFESNFPVLLECPHLLHSCLLNSSSVVQEHVLIPQVSGPRLDCIVCDIPNTEHLSDFKYFATTSDKTTAALVKGNSVLLVDASTLKTVGGPFEISQDTIEEITYLEFSSDNKWLFFGRFDKWFSVERGRIEDFSQFSGKSLSYKWVFFTPDGHYIAVKRNKIFDFQQTCPNMVCVLDVLSLWALLEIEQEGVGKLTCCFTELSKLIAAIVSPVGEQTKRLLKFLGMDPTWRQTGVTPVPYDPSCYCCGKLRELTESNQESSLSAVRQLISDLYPRLFYYQVWNLQTGRSLLEDAFLQGGQLNPITYVCHLTCAFTKLRGIMWCSGIEKAVSISNIATVNAVYALECELLSKEVCLQANYSYDEIELASEEELESMWVQMRELELKQEWVWKEQQELQRQREREKVKQLPEEEWISNQMWKLEQEQWWVCEWKQELERQRKQKRVLERQRELQQLQELQKKQMWKLKQLWARVVQKPREQEVEQVWERELEQQWKQELDQLWMWELELGQLCEHTKPPIWSLQRLRESELKQVWKWRWELEQLLEQKQGLEPLQEMEKLHDLEREQNLKRPHGPEQLEEMEELSMMLVLKPLWEEFLKPEGIQHLKQLQDQEQKLKQLRELEGELKQLWQLKLGKLLNCGLVQEGGKELEQLWEQELKQLWRRQQELKRLRKLEWKLEQLQEQAVEQLGQWKHNGRLECLWKQILEWVWALKHNWELEQRPWWSHLAHQWKCKLDQQWELDQQLKLEQQRELERELEWQLELEQKQMRERVWEWQRELEQKQKWELKEKRDLDLELGRQLERQWQQQRSYQRQRLKVLKQELEQKLMWELRWWELEQKQMRERELEREWERVQKGMREFCNLFSRKFKQFPPFFSNFPQRSSVVEKSIATAFTSSDTVISVSSDLILALWNSRMDEEKGFSFKFLSESLVLRSLSRVSHIDNLVFSDDGKRAVCRQGNKVQLYSIADSVKILCTLLEGDISDTDLVCLTFSADNILLLICVQDGKNEPCFYEWDVENKVMSSFKSPLLTVDCFCLSSDKTKFILCGEYEVGIWKYNNSPICLVARCGVAQKSSVRFSFCTVSLDNELLVCCIANIIIVFRLCVPDVFSSRQILRGHIGRIEFCKFLRVNRYLISCGVDGMVVLWDLTEARAVAFYRIGHGHGNIVSIAVSPEGERVLCFTSSGRVCLIRLWKLECPLSSKLSRESDDVTDGSLQLTGEIVSKCEPISSADDYKITDLSNSEEDEGFCLTFEDFLSSGNESD